MSDCLSTEDFERLHAGEMNAPVEKAARDHLAECADCRAREAEFLGQHRDIERALRDAANAAPVTPDSPFPSDTNPLDAGPDETHVLSPESSAQSVAENGTGASFPSIPGYQIVRVIASGGMGIVYEAVQLKLNRSVALKVLPDLPGQAERDAIKRFRNEASAAGKLHHTNIVPIYDFGQVGFIHYYTMELIKGKTLAQLIQRFSQENAPAVSHAHLLRLIHSDENGEGDQPVTTKPKSSSSGTNAHARDSSARGGRPYFRLVAKWMADVADALHYAHTQGIIHRDIKPGNLMLAHDGRIMVLDFGLAKTIAEHSLTTPGSLVGTLRYMSPEQAMAKRIAIDHRTDVFSLGATLYELLTLTPAFSGRDNKEILGQIIQRDPAQPRKVLPSVPRELETICIKSLEKDPAKRYESARDLADDLRRYIQDLPIVAKPTGALGRVVKFVKRRPAASVAMLALALLMPAVLSAVISIHGRNEAIARRDYAIAGEIESTQEAILAKYSRLLVAGWTFQNEKQWDKALATYREAQGLLPENWKAYYNIANTLKNMWDETEEPGLLREIERYLAMAEDLDPDRPNPTNLRGILFRNAGRYREAREFFDAAKAMDPKFSAADVNIASTEALEAVDRDISKARNYLVRARELDRQNDPMVFLNLATVSLAQGDPITLSLLRTATERTKSKQLFHLLVAKCCLELPAHFDLQTARDSAKAVVLIGIARYESRAYRTLAIAELALEHWREAKDAASRSIELKDVPAAYAHLTLSIAEARLGNGDEARRQFDLAQSGPHFDKLMKQDHCRVEAGYIWFDSSQQFRGLVENARTLLTK